MALPPSTASSATSQLETARDPATFPTDGWYLEVVLREEDPRAAARAVVETARAAGYDDVFVVPDPGPPEMLLGEPFEGVVEGGLTVVVVRRVDGPDPTLARTPPESLEAFRAETAAPLLAAARSAGLQDVSLGWLPFSAVYPSQPIDSFPPGDPATDVGAGFSQEEAVERVRGGDPDVPARAVLVPWWEYELAVGSHTPGIPPGRLVWVVTVLRATEARAAPGGSTPPPGSSSTSVLDASTGLPLVAFQVGPPSISPGGELLNN